MRIHTVGILFLLCSVSIAPAFSVGDTIYITEFLADGNSAVADENGEYPDWIELFNAGSETVNLMGWHLTDDPANPAKWTFPEVTISPNKYLIVFASGKDRAVTGSPLHANFKLAAEGGYLALVQSDGKTIAHQYNPYPHNQDGYSFGLHADAASFVSTGSTTRFFVPVDDSLQSNWISTAFDDSTWTNAPGSVGYGSAPGKLMVTLIEANTTVSNLATADRVIREKSLQRKITREQTDVINYLDNQNDGRFAPSVPFPGHTEGGDVDNFVLLATGTITISSSGTYTFVINSDDGARLRIDGNNVITDDTTHATQDALAQVNLTAGSHEIELVYFEQGGGAELELMATRGQFTTFVENRFRLVGDRENGGISLEGFGSLISQDISSLMKDLNSSVYLRIPFEVADPSLNYNLTFRIKYNDGFVAFLNGKEIARRNAPAIATWNSTATQGRTLEESLTAEEITILNTSNILQTGVNILAIHGMNQSREDADFLIFPELSGVAVQAGEQRYLRPATPGSINGAGVLGFAGSVEMSQKHGFYDAPFDVILSTTTKNGVIRYTTDCSTPSFTNGTVYTAPIRIEKTTVLRAAAFVPDFEPGAVNTQTYLFLSDILKQKQPAGYPSRWGNNVSADYEMDADVVNDSRYRNTIKDDLKTISVVSLVSDATHFFDSRTGIYTHPESKGVAWERPCSTEFFLPDGSREGFQINNGVRIQGGYGRSPNMRKHSFRMLFKQEYGSPTLRYKMFDNSSVDKFDQLVLRSGYNYTWHGGESGFNSNVGRADYMRDEFSRRLEVATGKAATHGRFVHLYLNGMYWGIYNLCERPDDGFAAEYFGGEKEEYDVVTGGSRNISTTQVKAGTKDAWNAMMTIAKAGGFTTTQNYEAIQQYLDIDALIDYMLVIYYTGNRDAPTVIGGGGTPWNFYSNRRRLPGEGFRFFCWDSEWTIEEPTANAITHHTKGYDDPSYLFLRLKTNPDFMIKVADHIQKHFFNGGVLTPQSTLAIYSDMAKQLDRAIVGESVRWGDINSSKPKTRDDNWLPEVTRIKTTYLPVRTDIVVKQLRNAGLYPNVPAPELSQSSGSVDFGSKLTITAQATTLVDTVTTPLVLIDHSWKYEQSGTSLDTNWMASGYDDSKWPSGKALFYAETATLSATKNTPLTTGPATFYFRSTFEIPESIDLSKATLSVSPFVDDGFIAYINGTEVYRIGMQEGSVTASTFSNRTVGDANYEGPVSIPTHSLQKGKNTIAVEVHQCNATSSDVVFGLTLNLQTPAPVNTLVQPPIYFTMDGSDPRLPSGEINQKSARRYGDPLIVTDNMTVKTRTYQNGAWSALTEASYSIGNPPASVASVQENLQITEMMFNPPAGDAFEFVELHNTHETSALSMNGVSFTNGIDLVFPNGVQIPAGGYILAVPSKTAAEQTAFRTQYGLDASVVLVGPYSGKLANGGEQITLTSLQTKKKLISFTFNDARGWPLAADGAGHSMVPKTSALPNEAAGALDYGDNWRMSYAIGGSPGKADSEPTASLVINELYANASPGQTEWIELFNTANATIDLGGWYLSDDENNLKKWAIPAAELSAGAWISYDKANHYDNPAGSGFGLSGDGDQLFLSYLPGVAGIDRVVDAVSFKAQDADRAYGRYTDGNPYFVLTKKDTRGKANEAANATLVIDEIMYQPSSTAGSTVEDASNEYIEIYNPSDQVRNLYNTDGVYRIDGGVQFTFPANLEIPAGGRLVVVNFKPSDAAALAAFQTKYQLTGANVTVVGPYSGKLSNQGERIALEKPKGIETDTLDTIWGIVDEVIYFSASPWTADTAGTGKSLQRIDPDRPGNNPANWVADNPTPGMEQTPVHAWMLY